MSFSVSWKDPCYLRTIHSQGSHPRTLHLMPRGGGRGYLLISHAAGGMFSNLFSNFYSWALLTFFSLSQKCQLYSSKEVQGSLPLSKSEVFSPSPMLVKGASKLLRIYIFSHTFRVCWYFRGHLTQLFISQMSKQRSIRLLVQGLLWSWMEPG